MKRAVIALLALALAACGAAADDHASHDPATVNVSVNAGDFVFEPASLELVAGQTVKIVVHNAGTQTHDFTIKALPLIGAAVNSGENTDHEHGAQSATGLPAAIHVAVAPGEIGAVEFTPAAAGTYEFDCTVPGHKEAGMVGKLSVKAP